MGTSLQPEALLCWLIIAVLVALLLQLGLSAPPAHSSDFGVYCSVRNLIYSCQLGLQHSSVRKEVWLFNLHEIQILGSSDFLLLQSME